MSAARAGRAAVAMAGLALAGLSLLAACEVTGVGVEGDVGVGYSGGYYEPYGYDYGGWGRGYRVGPGGHGYSGPGDHHFSGHGGAPAYRPAPAGRAAPSIPGRSRGR